MSTTSTVGVVGTPRDRVDGRLKVMGAATYPIDVTLRLCRGGERGRADVDVLFVGQPDSMTPLGTKGVGEIAIVGMAAAIANAVYHATGTRVRSLPISVEKVLAGGGHRIASSPSQEWPSASPR
jgi:hypothetical protein